MGPRASGSREGPCVVLGLCHSALLPGRRPREMPVVGAGITESPASQPVVRCEPKCVHIVLAFGRGTGRPPESPLTVADTTANPGRCRAPRAQGAFDDPDGCSQGAPQRKGIPGASSLTSQLRQRQRGNHSAERHVTSKPTATRRHQERDSRDNSQEAQESKGSGELVVCLADALVKEMAGCGRKPADKDVVRQQVPSAQRLHRLAQLEVLEHDVSGIAGVHERRSPADGQRARPVTSGHSVQQAPPRVPDGMPRERIEVILRTDNLCFVEPLDESGQLVAVTNIIVCDHDPVMGGRADPGEDSSNLPHDGSTRRGPMLADRGPATMMFGEHRGR